MIVKAYNSNKGVFSEKTNAEDLVPKTGIENQVQFLFWVIQMDYATKSANLYKNANALWIKNPSWIEADYLLNLTDTGLNKIITDLHPRYPNEIFLRIRKNALLLNTKYKGNAINIIKQAKSAAELLDLICEFRGFGNKLGNFLTRTYIDILKLDFKDIEEIYQPVDMHDVRLTYEWGFIPIKKMTSKNIKDVKVIWNKACKESGRSWIIFDKALWLMGSKGRHTNDIVNDFLYNIGRA